MSDSEPPSAWPAVERRRPGDRRTARPDLPPAAAPHDDAGIRTPQPRPRGRGDERRSGQERRDESAWQPVPIDPGPPVDPVGLGPLVEAATAARLYARARYSGFLVGAALETGAGTIVTGCNVENATYGLTLCAERVALVKALSEGHDRFARIAIVADTAAPTPPCGSCRQLLWEYCGDVEVILANLDGPTARLRLSALLPLPFDATLLE